MNKLDLEQLLGAKCAGLDEEGEVFFIETGLSFTDQDPVSAYVEVVGQNLRFFDDGEVIMHFENRGLKIEEHWYPAFIPGIVGEYGVKVNHPEEIELWSTLDGAADAFARFRTALKVLAQWEHDQFASDVPRKVLRGPAVAFLPSMA